jgi:hypothetical protein
MQTRSKKSGTRSKAQPKAAVKQPDDFLSVARRLGCDEDKVKFEKMLARLARAKSKPTARE